MDFLNLFNYNLYFKFVISINFQISLEIILFNLKIDIII